MFFAWHFPTRLSVKPQFSILFNHHSFSICNNPLIFDWGLQSSRKLHRTCLDRTARKVWTFAKKIYIFLQGEKFAFCSPVNMQKQGMKVGIKSRNTSLVFCFDGRIHCFLCHKKTSAPWL